MERFHKPYWGSLLRVAFAVFIIGLITIPWISSVVRKQTRRKELRELEYYVVYYHPVKEFDYYDETLYKENYTVFLMLNSPKEDITACFDRVQRLCENNLIDQVKELLTCHPEYGNMYEQFGEQKIKIYFMYPSDELPYGWEKDYLNIASNVHTGIFYAHAEAVLTIPVGAKTFTECTLREYS